MKQLKQSQIITQNVTHNDAFNKNLFVMKQLKHSQIITQNVTQMHWELIVARRGFIKIQLCGFSKKLQQQYSDTTKRRERHEARRDSVPCSAHEIVAAWPFVLYAFACFSLKPGIFFSLWTKVKSRFSFQKQDNVNLFLEC